jgi:hypothetical protein
MKIDEKTGYVMDPEDPMDADLNWHIDRLSDRICALRRKAFRLIR